MNHISKINPMGKVQGQLLSFIVSILSIIVQNIKLLTCYMGWRKNKHVHLIIPYSLVFSDRVLIHKCFIPVIRTWLHLKLYAAQWYFIQTYVSNFFIGILLAIEWFVNIWEMNQIPFHLPIRIHTGTQILLIEIFWRSTMHTMPSVIFW